MSALSDRRESLSDSKIFNHPEDRVWYDQFTSTDWVHDAIADSYRVKALRSRKDLWGRIRVSLDGVQGWILSALSGFVIALVAYTVNVAEATLFDLKDGYCTRQWYASEKVRRLRPPWSAMILSDGVADVLDRNVAPRALVPNGGAGQRRYTTNLSETRVPNSSFTSYSLLSCPA